MEKSPLMQEIAYGSVITRMDAPQIEGGAIGDFACESDAVPAHPAAAPGRPGSFRIRRGDDGM
jgi:hypothetical protein